VGRLTGTKNVAATFIDAPLPSTLADVMARNPMGTEGNLTAIVSLLAPMQAQQTSTTHQRPIPLVP